MSVQVSSVAIKDLQKGQKVLHYGSVFEIISPVRWFEGGGGVMVPVADCKRIEVKEYQASVDGILKGYDAFQGFWNVAVIN